MALLQMGISAKNEKKVQILGTLKNIFVGGLRVKIGHHKVGA